MNAILSVSCLSSFNDTDRNTEMSLQNLDQIYLI